MRHRSHPTKENNGEVEKCSTDERGDDDDDDKLPDDEHTLNEVNNFSAIAGILESGGVKTYECDVQGREQQQSKQEEAEDDVCSTSNLRSSRGKRTERELGKIGVDKETEG